MRQPLRMIFRIFTPSIDTRIYEEKKKRMLRSESVLLGKIEDDYSSFTLGVFN